MITVQFKLLPSPYQECLLAETSREFIAAVNALAEYMSLQTKPEKLSTSKFHAPLPSALKDEASRNALSVVRKYNKGVCGSFPVLKKPQAVWNNQNYRVKSGSIEIPVMVGGKSKRISVAAVIPECSADKLRGKLGTLRITNKRGKWIAQVAVEENISAATGSDVMGVDLGLKIPAVAVTGSGKAKFFGNGRQNKFIRRKHKSKRRRLGKAKKQKAIEKLDDREQRWMQDQDHKISRAVVNFAIENTVGTIRLEQLKNIRQTARTSRINEKSLHTWSFYRQSQFIDYKARMAGIKVEYVNPAYTSQACLVCGKCNKSKDRRYKCGCGFKAHRDIVGAANIIHAPVVSGKRKSA